MGSVSKNIIALVWLALIFLKPIKSAAQNTSILPPDTIVENQNTLLLLPIAFYLPETRFGIGLAGIYNFRFKGAPTENNPSQLRFSTDFTQNKQILIQINYELYSKDDNWKAQGEIGYYRFYYNHYGVGNNTVLESKETYQVNFPRIRLDILRQYNDIFAGIRYRYDNYEMVAIKPGGLIETENISGKTGGVSTGLGLILQFDKRDYIYNPTKGFFWELEYFINNSAIGSSFNYLRQTTNFVFYKSVAKDHTLAFNLYLAHTVNDIPFFDLPYFGSSSQARGFQDRRFKDKNMVVIQGEYRYPIFGRFSGVAFSSLSEVSPSLSEFSLSSFKVAAGLGLRYKISKTERSRLRLDYGYSKDGGAFYITINDAF